MLNLLFPPKCLVCQKLLSKQELDLCLQCRAELEDFPKTKLKLSFLAGWTAIWYYKDDVRKSLLQYKFSAKRNRRAGFGRLLAMKLLQENLTDFDILSWVPLAPARKFSRGYDQDELLAQAVGKELRQKPVATLRKIRNTPPQSGILDASARRANVMGAYRVISPKQVTGKRILLIDDVITTGSTISECARTLLTAGAKEVYCAAVAASSHEKKHNSR